MIAARLGEIASCGDTKFDAQMLEQNRHDLMSRPGVLGVGVGASDTDSQQAAVVVYVDKTAAARPELSTHIDGVPVKVQLTDPFVAF